MGSKLKGTGVEFPDGTLQTTSSPIEKTIQRSDGGRNFTYRNLYNSDGTDISVFEIGIAMSKDGKYWVLPKDVETTLGATSESKNLFISSNYGKDFNDIHTDGTTPYLYRSPKMSSTGQYIIVSALIGDNTDRDSLTNLAGTAGGTTFVVESQDYGQTWTKRDNDVSRLGSTIAPTGNTVYWQYASCAISPNGLHRINATYENNGGHNIAYSIRHGYGQDETYTYVSSVHGDNPPLKMAISNDGQTICIQYFSRSGGFRISRDGGNTWNYIDPTTLPGAPELGKSFCMNEDASRIYASFSRHGGDYREQRVYLSTDKGLSWTQILDYRSFESISYVPNADIECSDDGQNVVLVAMGYSSPYKYGILISEDSGTTWNLTDVPDYSTSEFSGYGYYNNLAISNDLSHININVFWAFLNSVENYRLDVPSSNSTFEGDITVGSNASQDDNSYRSGTIRYNPKHDRFEFLSDQNKVSFSPDDLVDNELLYYNGSEIKSSGTDKSFLTSVDDRVTAVEDQTSNKGYKIMSISGGGTYGSTSSASAVWSTTNTVDGSSKNYCFHRLNNKDNASYGLLNYSMGSTYTDTVRNDVYNRVFKNPVLSYDASFQSQATPNVAAYEFVYDVSWHVLSSGSARAHEYSFGVVLPWTTGFPNIGSIDNRDNWYNGAGMRSPFRKAPVTPITGFNHSHTESFVLANPDFTDITNTSVPDYTPGTSGSDADGVTKVGDGSNNAAWFDSNSGWKRPSWLSNLCWNPTIFFLAKYDGSSFNQIRISHFRWTINVFLPGAEYTRAT